MCGQGEWFLEDKYTSKKLKERKFYSMTEEQKKRAFEKFYVMTIVSDEPPRSEDPVPLP